MSFLGNQVKERTDISDEVIASNMLSSAKAAANAYLNAALISPTPELRAMCEESLQQILAGHSQLSKLVIDQGWESPYDSPEKQLLDMLDKSKLVVETNEK
ncbi:spore coat protein [Halothermothrix orenii]|uniref:Coat F domain protein n=1 Tax=Halothermothrix orenii (strain H 168 / OCM 544 / DSM 9562) TaxID=373903 RepID=B8D269_HALOH|nr:spore coat protein [Halothermothrix orenii]ACL69296.1 Coat F domain protein [Halothermothrix orenii H 168]